MSFLIEKEYISVIRPCFEPNIQTVIDEYKDIKPVGFEHVERMTFDMKMEYEFDNLIGYLSTWSPLNAYKQKNPEAQDPLKIFANK